MNFFSPNKVVMDEIESLKAILASPLCLRDDAWPKASSDKIFIWEALRIVGRSMFGPEWSDDDLQALIWDQSPFARVQELQVEADKKARENFARQNRPKAKPPFISGLRGSGYTPKPTGKNTMSRSMKAVDYNSHKLAWQIHNAAIATQNQLNENQERWENNQVSIGRLLDASNWIGNLCRDGKIKSFARLTSGGGLDRMDASDWNCSHDLTERFSQGGYNRLYPELLKRWPIFIFLDRSDLERGMKALSHGGQSITSIELEGLSPQLRFMVNKALQYGYIGQNKPDEPREALAAQLMQDWETENDGEKLDKTPAQRMSFLIRHPPK